MRSCWAWESASSYSRGPSNAFCWCGRRFCSFCRRCAGRTLAQVARVTAAVTLTVLPAAGLTLLHNKQVTGSWTTLPYMLSRYQYGVPTTFTVSPIRCRIGNSLPVSSSTMRSKPPRTARARTLYKLSGAPGRPRAVLPLLLPAAALSGAAFLLAVAAPVAICVGRPGARGVQPGHELLPLLLSALHRRGHVPVRAGERDRAGKAQPVTIRGYRRGREAAQLLVFLCAAQFLFWYGFHLFANTNASVAMLQYDAWDDVNHGDP
jgi:hypothetical protein